VPPTISDNCPGTTVVGVRSDGQPLNAVYPVGITTINWTATDSHTLTATCVQTVTVTDNILPTINCPAAITVQCAADVPAVNISSVVASDNCPGVVVTWEGDVISNQTCTNKYVITRTYKATDAVGNSSSCTQTITVNDNTAPVVICPANITLDNTAGQCGTNVSFTATATDNCVGAVAITYSPASGSFFAVGTTPVTVTATDVCGNSSTCTFNVVVNDIEDPVIHNLPASFSVNADENVCNTLVSWTPPTATDNCPNVSLVSNYPFFDAHGFVQMSVGVHTVTYTATDAHNHIVTGSFTVTVVDNQLPIITGCPSNITVNAANGRCNAQVFWNPPTASDNCPGVSLSTDHLPGEFYPVGTTVVTYTATDHAGQTTICTFNVTVVDNQDPVITCPANITVNNDVDRCSASIVITPATATDNCDVLSVDGVRSDNRPLNADYPVGTTIITWTATDVHNNTSQCNQIIRVLDRQAPAITCPSGITLNCQDDNSSVATGVATATDNCTGTEEITITQSDVSTQDPSVNNPAHYNYSITRTWRATDVAGNFSECVQTITVRDITQPAINCPSNIIRNNDAGVCGAIITFGATATDNCSPVTITYSKNPGTLFIVGTTTVVATAKDVSGNAITCSFTVTVLDNEKPVITCPVSVTATRNTNSGLCTYKVQGNEFNATATDNCGVTSLAYVLTGATTGAGTSLNNVNLVRGMTTVTWTAKDAAGNTITCSFIVNVIDDQNATSYIIYATKEAKFGENNYINGDVGVTASNGKAEFKKYDVLDPFFVRAYDINVQLPSSVNNKVFSPATGGPAPTFMNYSAAALSGNYTQTVSGIVPAGNYKNLTIKAGVVATVNGSDYGKITIEEGATVTFTSSNINAEELKIGKGKKGIATTNVIFSNPTSFKIRDRVTIEEDCRINENGPKVTFYLGDAKKDEENFQVKGDDTHVTANIMIPNGKLKITGGVDNCIMTGWYIIEKVESDGKYVTWNQYNCSGANPLSNMITSRGGVPTPAVVVVVEQPVVTTPVETFQVKVYPNPSSTDFSLQVMSSSTEPILVRLMDANGMVLNVNTTILKGSTIKLGSDLRAGTYFAEVTQGKNHQTVKLIKLN